MRFAYLVNQDGHRVIRWWTLALFCGIVLALPVLGAAAGSMALVGDLRFAGSAVPLGFFVAAMMIGRNWRLPVDQLPIAA